MPNLPYSGPALDRLLGGASRQTPGKGGTSSDADIVPLLQQGVALQMKGSVGLAAEVYQRILDRHPNQPDALHLMGTVAMTGGQVDAAIDLFKRAAARKPDDASIRCNLASALLQKDDTVGAEHHLRKALKINPELSTARCLLAHCQALKGDRETARAMYEAVLAGAPEESQALIGCGDLCVTIGDIPAAQSLYRKALAVGKDPALALAGLATCETPAKDSPEALEIKRYLGMSGLRPLEYMNLSYVAGQIDEAAGDYDEAFAHFAAAKTLSAVTFSIEAHREMLAALKRAFTRPFFDARTKYGDRSIRPIFIVGMPRSGTTLTEQIISRHPSAAAAGELPDMIRTAALLGWRRDSASAAKEFGKRVAKLTPHEVKALAAKYLAVLDRTSTTALNVTDKMPHNFEHLGLIALLFPNVRIIHCRRNPLDNCTSLFTTQLKDHLHGYTLDLTSLGTYYREYSALMAHWHEVLPLPIYDLDYERLIASQEEESRKLIDFIGLPWDPACLSPHESSRAVSTQSRMQVRRPIYRSSVARWRRYEKHLGPLKAALGDLVGETSAD